MEKLLKTINPNITELKTGTPIIKHGDKYIVAGIGGDFIPGGTSGAPVADIVLGQVNVDGDFQAFSFNGTEASNSGDPEVVENYYTYNGVLPVPNGGSGVDISGLTAVSDSVKSGFTFIGASGTVQEGTMPPAAPKIRTEGNSVEVRFDKEGYISLQRDDDGDLRPRGYIGFVDFFRCASVAQGVLYYTVANASEYPECNGDYYQFSGTGNENVYKHESSEIYLFRHLYEDLAEIGSKPEASQDRKIYYQRYAWMQEGIPSSGWEDINMMDFGVSVTQKKVDAPKTWCGYKAVLSDGVYSFEETLTEGLRYNNLVPAVGGVYDATASVKISILSGVVPTPEIIKADLLTNTESSVPFTEQGNVHFGVMGGKQCCILDGNSCLYNKNISIPGAFTLSFSAYVEEENAPVFSMGDFGDDCRCYEVNFSRDSVRLYTRGGNPESLSTESSNVGKWAHIVCTFDGMNREIYVNGVRKAIGNVTIYGLQGVLIGTNFGFSIDDIGRDGVYFVGGIRYLRMYNRILSQDEIDVLFMEQQ